MRWLAVVAALLSGCVHAAPAPTAHKAFPAGLIDITDIDDAELKPVQAKFDELVAAGERTVMFRINSFGGAVWAGWDFVQHIEDAKKAHDVHVVCALDVKAMSMGAVFLESFCDERLMSRRGLLMFHGAAAGVKGKADDVRSTLSEMDAMNNAIANTCAERMGMDLAAYHAKTDHQDWFLAADEALALGAVDGFVRPSDLPPPYVLEKPSTDDLLKRLLGGNAK